MVLSLLQQGVHCLFLPKDSTHITQVGDNGPFAAHTKRMTELADQWVRTHDTPAGYTMFDINMLHVIKGEEAMTPAVIKAAFEQTGTWPWNRDAFVARVNLAASSARPAASVDGEDSARLRGLALTVVQDVTGSRKAPKKKRMTLGPGELSQSFTGEQVVERDARRKEGMAAERARKAKGKAEAAQAKQKRAHDKQAKLQEAAERERLRGEAAPGARVIRGPEYDLYRCHKCKAELPLVDRPTFDNEWSTCTGCGRTFCGDCTGALDKHEKRCGADRGTKHSRA